MKPCFSVRALPGAWLFVFLVLVSVLRATEADLASLRAKAEIGNAIAEYNLGLAYAEGRVVPKDPIEAYVWLSLAAENGATGKALSVLVDLMSDDQLRSAKSRLEERRGVISTRLLAQAHSALSVSGPSSDAPEVAPAAADAPVVSKTSPVAPARVVSVPAVVDRTAVLEKEIATLRADNAKLGGEVASVWKDLDGAKAATAAAGQRAEQAEAAANQRAKEVSALQAERDQLRQQLAATSAAAKPPAPAREPADQAKALAADQAKALAAARAEQAKTATQLESVRKDLASARAANADLTVQAKKLAEEKESLSRQLAARGDATRDLASLRTQVERDEADLKTLRASNAELLSANQRLERQDRSSVDAARQLEQAQGTITRLQAENADLKTKVAALPATPTPAPAVAAEGSADELTRLKQELARARETVEMTVRSYALIRQENERLKAQLAKLQPAPAVASP